MQTERYISFVAVTFTMKITLTGRAHISHQTLIRVLRPLPMRTTPQRPNRISFISSRGLDPSSWRVFREAENSNALGTVVWIRSGIVRRFTWMYSCTSTLFLHLPFAFSFAWWILSHLSAFYHNHTFSLTRHSPIRIRKSWVHWKSSR